MVSHHWGQKIQILPLADFCRKGFCTVGNLESDQMKLQVLYAFHFPVCNPLHCHLLPGEEMEGISPYLQPTSSFCRKPTI